MSVQRRTELHRCSGPVLEAQSGSVRYIQPEERKPEARESTNPCPTTEQKNQATRLWCSGFGYYQLHLSLGLVITTAIFLHSFIHRQEADRQEEKVTLKEKEGLLSYFQGFFHPFLCFVCILSNQRLGGHGGKHTRTATDSTCRN